FRSGPRANSLGTLPVTGHGLDAAIAGIGSRSTVSISGVDGSHPALRGLEGLRGGKFTRYVGIVTAPEDDVLLELDTGAPLLVERRGADRKSPRLDSSHGKASYALFCLEKKSLWVADGRTAAARS